MATDLKTYDPAGIILQVGGKIISGFEPGTFISLVRTVDTWVLTIGPDGVDGIRTKSNNRSALMTMTLRQSATSNLILSNLANAGEVAGEDGLSPDVVDVSITDLNSPDVNYTTGKGWIQKPADGVFADTPQGRAWQIMMLIVPMVHGGTPGQAAVPLTT